MTEIEKSEHNHWILHIQIERKQHIPSWGGDALVHLAESMHKKYSDGNIVVR